MSRTSAERPLSRLRAAGRLSVLAAAALLAVSSPAAAQDDLDVPYVPTPPEVVDEMLRLGDPAPGDTLYDLGSGDGRIVIAAARRWGTTGVGVELDSGRVATAREKAAEAGVDGQVRFVRGDLFEADLRPADVVTLYLFPEVNLDLRPKLFEQLDPGDRVVSHDFDMGAWSADSVVRVATPDGGTSTVYLWVMPADVEGTWEVTVGGSRPLTLEVDQRFQRIRPALSGGGRVTDARVRGDSVAFTLRGVPGTGGARLRGVVEGGRMAGSADDGSNWTARRVREAEEGSVLSWEEAAPGG